MNKNYEVRVYMRDKVVTLTFKSSLEQDEVHKLAEMLFGEDNDVLAICTSYNKGGIE